MPLWQYLILKIDLQCSPDDTEVRWRTSDGKVLGGEADLPVILNELGLKGWEIVSAPGVQNIACVVFKRAAEAFSFAPPIINALEAWEPDERGKRLNDIIDGIPPVEAAERPRRGRPPKARS